MIDDAANEAMYLCLSVLPHTRNVEDGGHMRSLIALRMMSFSMLYQENKYAIFGYGEVGSSIAFALRKAAEAVGISVLKIDKQILCVDLDVTKLIGAREDYSTFHLQPELSGNIPALKEKLRGVDYIITATGVGGCLSKYFDPVDLQHATLINMGAQDEFGKIFTLANSNILGGRTFANFSLDDPFLMRHLDPIFTLSLLMAKRLYDVTLKLKNGLNVVPADDDIQMFEKWRSFYPDSTFKRYEKTHKDWNERQKNLIAGFRSRGNV